MNLAPETVVGLPRTNLVQPVTNPFTAPEARDPFRTDADSIDVAMESQRAPETQRDATTNELLERAAAMGPARRTWESIVLTADPILSEKRLPHVAERRERLTRIVKMTLGACVAVCAIALGVTALSALSGDASASTHAAAAAPSKTVASKGVVPVEPLDGTKHGKAARRAAPSVTTAAIVRPKRR